LKKRVNQWETERTSEAKKQLIDYSAHPQTGQQKRPRNEKRRPFVGGLCSRGGGGEGGGQSSTA